MGFGRTAREALVVEIRITNNGGEYLYESSIFHDGGRNHLRSYSVWSEWGRDRACFRVMACRIFQSLSHHRSRHVDRRPCYGTFENRVSH